MVWIVFPSVIVTLGLIAFAIVLTSFFLDLTHNMSPKIYLTGAASAEMFSRLSQKCFGATQRCPPPPKNVTFHPRMFCCHPKIVLLHPKMFWVHPKGLGRPNCFFA